MPGYTGHKSAQLREAEEAQSVQAMTLRQQADNKRMVNKVPGYQGYVP